MGCGNVALWLVNFNVGGFYMKLVAKLENGIVDIIDIEQYKKDVEIEYSNLKTAHSVEDEVIQAILKKKDDKRTPDELMKIVLRKQIDDGYKKRISKYDSYLPFKEEKYTEEIKEGYFKRPQFREEDGFVIESYHPDIDYSYIKRKIREKQEEIASTDYMVIKAYEAKILGAKEPYDSMVDIINQRQTLRDDINKLQELLNLRK